MTTIDPIETGYRARSSGAYARRRRLVSARRMVFGPRISGARLSKQINDFLAGSKALFWQRQGMYIGSSLLAAYYYDLLVAISFFCLLQLTEVLDNLVSSRIIRRLPADRAQAQNMVKALLLTSTLSALTVASFTVVVASMEGTGQHLTPLFFLFAAGLFAALNNHQLPRVLLARLVIYGAVFLYIPARDLLIERPLLESELWLQLATVIFVLFFVIECAVIFLRLYQGGLDTLDELRKERDKAQAALEVKSQFVSIVSHELRTPLTSILASLSLARTGAFDNDADSMTEVVDIAYLNSKRLSDLINDLLDLQKIESGQMTYHFQPIDVDGLVAGAVQLMKSYSELARVQIVIRDSTPGLTVRGDEARLGQVMSNLLSNAIKFSEKDQRIYVSVESDGQKARISVEDTGAGIPPNSRDLVFGKFTQIDPSDNRAHQGTGLGLNIVEKIIDAHGGTIDYDSEFGKGTTFTLVLDMAEPS